MAKRENGQNARGGNFTEEEIEAVWKKGSKIPDVDAAKKRTDCCGATIERDRHGNVDAKTGWEIDHIKPVAAGGTDALSNLQPLQWENNRAKSDDTTGKWKPVRTK